MRRLALIAALAACGGGGAKSPEPAPSPSPAPAIDAGVPAPDASLEFEEIELGTGQNFIPLLKVGAEQLGCSVVAEQPDPPGASYQCEEGLVFMVQIQQKLRYTCQGMDMDACRGVMEKIYKKVLEAAGGG